MSAKQVFWKSIVTVFALDVRFGTCAMWCIFIGHIGHGGCNTVDVILMWRMSFAFWKGKQIRLKKRFNQLPQAALRSSKRFMTTSRRKKRNSPQRHIRISTNLNELHATDNASRPRYVKAMGVQGIVVQVPCIVVKKIQIHHLAFGYPWASADSTTLNSTLTIVQDITKTLSSN